MTFCEQMPFFCSQNFFYFLAALSYPVLRYALIPLFIQVTIKVLEAVPKKVFGNILRKCEFASFYQDEKFTLQDYIQKIKNHESELEELKRKIVMINDELKIHWTSKNRIALRFEELEKRMEFAENRISCFITGNTSGEKRCQQDSAAPDAEREDGKQ